MLPPNISEVAAIMGTEQQPNITEQLERLASLRLAGALTEEQFQGLKEDLISRLRSDSATASVGDSQSIGPLRGTKANFENRQTKRKIFITALSIVCLIGLACAYEWNSTPVTGPTERPATDTTPPPIDTVQSPRIAPPITPTSDDLCQPNMNLPRVPGPKPTTWCTIEADNGAALSVDKGSIEKSSGTDPYADVIIRMQPSGGSTLGELMTVRFSCGHQVAEITSADGFGSIMAAPPRSILGLALKMTCSTAPTEQEPSQAISDAPTAAEAADICKHYGLSDEECASSEAIATGPRPDYCNPGWGRMDTGLSNQQLATCTLTENSEAAH